MSSSGSPGRPSRSCRRGGPGSTVPASTAAARLGDIANGHTAVDPDALGGPTRAPRCGSAGAPPPWPPSTRPAPPSPSTPAPELKFTMLPAAGRAAPRTTACIANQAADHVSTRSSRPEGLRRQLGSSGDGPSCEVGQVHQPVEAPELRERGRRPARRRSPVLHHVAAADPRARAPRAGRLRGDLLRADAR